MMREMHVCVAGSHEAFCAQSESVVHCVGHARSPLHLYAGHVGETSPAGRGVHVPGIWLQTPQPSHSVEQQYPSTQLRDAQSSFFAHVDPTSAPESIERARMR